MIIAGILRSLQRRWYVVLLGILAAAAASAVVWTTVPPSYERLASLLLLPGASTLPEDVNNPYLYLGGLTTATDVLVGASAREVALADILDAVPGTQIMIGRDTSTSAPVISATVEAGTDAAAIAAMSLVLAHIRTTLENLQEEEAVPSSERISLQELYVDDESMISQKDRLIYSAATGGGALLFFIVLALVVDNAARRSRTRRSTHPRRARDAKDVERVTEPSETTDLEVAEDGPRTDEATDGPGPEVDNAGQEDDDTGKALEGPDQAEEESAKPDVARTIAAGR